MSGSSSLRVRPNSQFGTFEFYLWAYIVDQNDIKTIYNKIASKLYVQINQFVDSNA